ncbi:MAG TPA: ABC-ATPase domain-containing protein [Candidatus Corynebacterium avicola]|uniref:ABC-ATPase domain-containing protein n=1 Tax=Candidatus Corynebacterium avicola TaxID=2838527 RepID=A0A9D1RNE4_9CORY|nr:ABC-ATPase domain-containing protein [Candidatus Corynebacterium avicola]
MQRLDHLLRDLDGSGYGGYKRLRGSHTLHTPSGEPVRLTVDKVQADPFAPPSLIQVSVPLAATGVDPSLSDGSTVPLRDHLTRRLADAIAAANPRGGKSAGFLAVDAPGQQVLDRASVVVDQDEMHVRLQAALPAQGRRIRGRAASTLLCDILPEVVQDALLDLSSTDHDRLAAAVELFRDQEFLRAHLRDAGLVGFLSDGSVLPRAAGNSQRPLTKAVPLTSPDSLRHEVTLPSARTLTGLGVPRGVTLIVGGGYHGKSTLLKALELGIYNHVAGDGREFVVTDPTAVSLRAEDGRPVSDVDISAFLHDLPGGTDTASFSTTNASGSTSQAAGLVEALDDGAGTLLIDEDTSATNFMIRDDRMRKLVPSAKEPITPLVDRVRSLWEDHGVSTVLVAGGSGMFIDVADTVIMLDAYRPVDVTDRARELAGTGPAPDSAPFTMPAPQVPPATRFLSEGRGKKGPRPPQAKGLHSIRVGDSEIDLSACSQLVDSSQTSTIAAALARVELDGSTPLGDVLRTLPDLVSHPGKHPGHRAGVRIHDVAAAVRRYRR